MAITNENKNRLKLCVWGGRGPPHLGHRQHLSDILTDIKEEMPDGRVIYAVTGGANASQLDEFCRGVINRVSNVIGDVDRGFRRNIAISFRDGGFRMLGWSVIFFRDPRIKDLIIGKEGEEDPIPSWRDTPPSFSGENIPPEIPLPELEGCERDIILKDYAHREEKGSYVYNSLIALNIPKEAEESDIMKIFEIYSRQRGYPKIRIIERGERRCIIRYNNRKDADAALALQTTTLLISRGGEVNIISVKRQRRYGSFKRRARCPKLK